MNLEERLRRYGTVFEEEVRAREDTIPSPFDARAARPPHRKALASAVLLVAAALIGVGMTGQLRTKPEHVRAGAPDGHQTSGSTAPPTIDLRLLIDDSLPDLDHVVPPSGTTAVADKSGVVRGFASGRPVEVRLGDGAYVGQAYEVSDLEGRRTGYVLGGLGFVPVSTTNDPSKLTTLLAQRAAMRDALVPADSSATSTPR